MRNGRKEARVPNGCLLVMMQPALETEGEFNDWYDTDHIPERMAIPGFLAARRYQCVDGWPRYLAIYDLESPDVLESAPYLAVAEGAYTNWTRRVLQRVRVFRHALVQIAPGQALLTRCTRLLLIRFTGLQDAAMATVDETLDALSARNPVIGQIRTMREATTGALFVQIESRSPLLPGAVTAADFGVHAATIDLWNSYVAR
jgi:hypothetical protein